MRQPATYEDLLKVPDHLVAEIVEGELFTSPRPASRHARASTALSSELHQRFERGNGGPGGWWIVTEPELHLGRDILVPDISGWRKERMPEFPDVAWFDLAPDWICEVVSPTTARLDRIRKLPRYATHGIHWAWIVDPIAKTLEAYRLEQQRWSLVATHEGSARLSVEPFENGEIDLGALWIEP